MLKVEPRKVDDKVFGEIFFAKIFPVQELLDKGIMKRTKYGLTLRKQFKQRILKKMVQLGYDEKIISNFKEREYLRVDMERLWIPIVCAICELYECKFMVKNNEVYVPEKVAVNIETLASAVYTWFLHVRRLIWKFENENIEFFGDYV